MGCRNILFFLSFFKRFFKVFLSTFTLCSLCGSKVIVDKVVTDRVEE